MELDDFKELWQDQKTKQQQHELTSTIIKQMKPNQHNLKLNSIAYPEIIGIVVCVASAVFVGINFGKLESGFLQGIGVACIVLLLLLSGVSLLSLLRLKMPADFDRPHAETLQLFAQNKIAFFKLQKLNVTLTYLLLLTVVILLPKFFGGTDISGNRYIIFTICLGYIFVLFVSRMVSRFYQNTLTSTEKLLEELQKQE